MSPTQTLGPSTGLRTANDHPSQHRLQALGEKGPNDLELARSICSLSGTRWWGSEKIVYKHSFFCCCKGWNCMCVLRNTRNSLATNCWLLDPRNSSSFSGLRGRNRGPKTAGGTFYSRKDTSYIIKNDPEDSPVFRICEIEHCFFLQRSASQMLRKPSFCFWGAQNLNFWSGGAPSQHLPPNFFK